MGHPNLELVSRFFESFARRDPADLQQVLDENVKWVFPGHHPMSGTKIGIEAVVDFFDNMGVVMGRSNVKAEKLITEANDQYVVECQHVRTHRADGDNLDQCWCVIWKIADGKIIEGRHFAADQYAVDGFFTNIMT